jgi:hypothetical protein
MTTIEIDLDDIRGRQHAVFCDRRAVGAEIGRLVRDDMPALLDEVERLRGSLTDLRGMVQEHMTTQRYVGHEAEAGSETELKASAQIDALDWVLQRLDEEMGK